MEALWGRQVAAGGPPQVGILSLGHFGVGIWGSRGTPKSEHPWALRGWDNDFGGPYMSFGQSIAPHSLVAP